jgi:MSHA biogenesis protein MshK
MLDNLLARNAFSKSVIVATLLLMSSLPVMAGGDPTRPPGKNDIVVVSESNGDTAINVSAILTKNQVSYAVINQKWLKAGESILGWRVVEINNTGVFLQNISEPNDKPLRFLVNENSDFKKQINDE